MGAYVIHDASVIELYIGRGERTGVVVVLWWLMGVLDFCKFCEKQTSKLYMILV